MTIIRCGRLVDGVASKALDDMVLEIEGERITNIRPAKRTEPSDGLIDLSAFTVVPGLIDSHEHLGIDIGDEEAQCAEPVEYIVARCVRNAGTIVRSGITTIRDVGEKARIGPMMKRAIAEGIVPGPRVFAAGQNITRTGGHAWFLGRQADGAEDLRLAVREQVHAGADLIKVMVSGGVSTPGSDVLAAEFTTAEVVAVIDEAHRRGRKVAAHGHGGQGVRDAICAGVDSIEHGVFLTEDDVALMIERGTYLVVTAGVFEEIQHGPEVPAFMKAKLSGAMDAFLALLRTAHQRGLRIVVGTDENHGKLWREMELLVGVGFSPLEALRAGTVEAAALLGAPDLGSLEVGKLADLVAVEGDPTRDVRALSAVRLVMQGGAVVRAAA